MTPSADQVVVIVAYPGFIESGPARRLDPAQDSRLDKRVQIVVNGLPRKRPQPLPSGPRDELRIPVLAFMLDDFQNRQPRRRKAHIRLLQQVQNFVAHGLSLAHYLYPVQIFAAVRHAFLGIVMRYPL
jgi:hypothetical protein